jgi:hypothetical protein
MRSLLVTTAVALALLGTSPARADRDPDLGVDQVSPPAANPTAPDSEPATDTPLAAPESAAPSAEGVAAESRAAGSIARATLTTAVLEREPQDSISELGNDQSQVFYFTELHDFEGQTLVHRWEFKGEVMAEVPFRVGGPRWRVYSSKNLEPSWLGEWTVKVVDEAGTILTSKSFQYQQAMAPEPPTPEASTEGSEPPPASPIE